MSKAVRLGVIYFAIVFTVAFALGVLRVLFISPAIGSFAAVLLEVPLVLGVSWVVAKRLLGHYRLDATECVFMGGFAFGLLMAAECILAVAVFDQSAKEWAMALVTPVGLIGLSGQFAFGLMPLLVRLSAQLYSQKPR
jgi:hypothetical protein